MPELIEVARVVMMRRRVEHAWRLRWGAMLVETDFGQNRLWPKPTLAKPSLAKLKVSDV